MTEISNILFGILGLSFIILIHELGHLVVARMMGIEVEVFSVGFGYVLYKHKTAKTEYRLSLIPFGGFCRMKGGSTIMTQEQDVSAGSFYAASPAQRIGTLLAGPFANLLFSFLVFFIIALVGRETPYFDNRIVLFQDIFPEQATAAQAAASAGLQTGDRITMIEGEEILYFNDISNRITRSPLLPLEIVTERNGRTIPSTLTPATEPETGQGRIGVFPWINTSLTKIADGGPAQAAGLLVGDKILSIDQQKVAHAWDIVRIVRAGQQATVNVTVLRNNIQKTYRLVLPRSDIISIAAIGATFRQETFIDQARTPLEALGRASTDVAYVLDGSIKGILSILQNNNFSQGLAGPIRITYLTGQLMSPETQLSLKNRIINFVNFLGIISLAILFMNLLPIPITDGGQTLLFSYELITRKLPSRKFVYYYHIIGMIIIFTLLLIVMWNDITFLVGL